MIIICDMFDNFSWFFNFIIIRRIFIYSGIWYFIYSCWIYFMDFKVFKSKNDKNYVHTCLYCTHEFLYYTNIFFLICHVCLLFHAHYFLPTTLCLLLSAHYSMLVIFYLMFLFLIFCLLFLLFILCLLCPLGFICLPWTL